MEAELEVVQMLDLAGKDYNVGFTCYRNRRKLFKELKSNILMSEQMVLAEKWKLNQSMKWKC